jgi:hypothetical protein
VLPFVCGPPPAPMDRSDARIQEALGRGRSLVAHASRQYVASTWTNVIGRFRPFRPVRAGAAEEFLRSYRGVVSTPSEVFLPRSPPSPLPLLLETAASSAHGEADIAPVPVP